MLLMNRDICGQDCILFLQEETQYDQGFLSRCEPKDQAEQIILPKPLRQRALLLAHYPVLAGHPGGSRMYQTLRRTFYWPSMAMDVYNNVRHCTSCAKERISLRKHASYLSLFPAQNPLEFVAIDILGPLPRTSNGNRYHLVITDRFSKIGQTIPLRKTTAETVARAFCEHWVFIYGPPAKLLYDNGGQFNAKLFPCITQILGIRSFSPLHIIRRPTDKSSDSIAQFCLA